MKMFVWPTCLAEKVDAPRAAGDGVGHGRIRNENIVRIDRQIDDDRLLQTEFQAAMRAGTRLGYA